MQRRRLAMLAAACVASLAPGVVATSGIVPSWLNPPTADARIGQVAALPGGLPPYAVIPYGSGLALTPPMGWNPFNHFRRSATAEIVKETARVMVSTGMRAAGYRYVNLDGGWNLLQRSSYGQLEPDPAKFPDGIKSLADYVHSLGLRFGIYLSAGYKNCAGTSAGGFGHYNEDARLFAQWGVDYLKFDWCFVPVDKYPHLSRDEVGLKLARSMADALLATGRPIVFDVNDPTSDRPWTWARNLGNLWRTTPDIHDNYGSMFSHFVRDLSLYEWAGPDHWNDPDMLEVGNGGMTATEDRAMFSLWAELAAPLIAGNDLRHMSGVTLSILMNADVIAVDQDPLGQQGYAVSASKDMWVLTKPLADGNRSVVLFNAGATPALISTTVGDIGLTGRAQYMLRDLWDGAVSTTSGRIGAVVPAHGVVMYLVTPIQ